MAKLGFIGLGVMGGNMVARLLGDLLGAATMLETFWPSTDGWSAARIEEEIVVTEKGHEVITRFPAEELLVAGRHYFTVNGPLPALRESEPEPTTRVREMIEASSRQERVGVGD